MKLVRNLLPYVFLPAVGTSINAQNENRKNVFSGHAGVSLPTNEFAGTTFGNDAGFATAGGNIELNYYRYTAKYFALNASIGYTAFSFNERACTDEYYLVLNQTEGIKTGQAGLICTISE